MAARVIEAGGFLRDHGLQIAQTAREHLRRRGETGGLGFDQEMHGIDRHEVDARAFLRPPVTKAALVVLTAAQNGENLFELRVHFLPVQSEIGFIRPERDGKRRRS